MSTDKMKILLNAYNLRVGGGESVGIGIINSIYRIDTDNQYIILLNKSEGYQKFTPKKNILIHYVPNFFTYSLLGNFLSILYLRYIVARMNPDAIFSMGNYAIPVKGKQLLFLHWPYIVYPDSIAWQKQKWSYDYIKRKVRAWILRKQLRFATAITVQTPLMKNQYLKYFKYPTAVHVIESSASEINNVVAPENSDVVNKITQLKTDYKDHLFLLCLSKYYTHKNLEILLPLAEEIKRNNAHFKILINLEPLQHSSVKKILNQIHDKKLDDIIFNLGKIPPSSLYKVYQQADGFILPTLLESFGIIYREAMIAGVPIFTSDLDFAHEACKDAAFYFNPLDHRSIYDCLVNAYAHPDQLKRKTNSGKEQAKTFLSWEEITEKYLQILKEL